MKKMGKNFRYLFLTVIMSLLMIFITPNFTLSDELVDWYHREIGYEYALKDSNENETPLILFFYLESDELSQKLRDEYFRSYEMYEFLNDIPKVDINLDGNDFEKEIADQYNVKQEPALLVVFPFSETEPKKVSPFLKDSEMTNEEFVNNLRNVIVLAYSNLGYDNFEKQEYEKAIKYYSFSIKYDPGRAYSYFAIGSVYHAMAIEEKSKELFKKAEENYLKALKIDPEFKECKEELEKLHENIEKLGLK